MNEDNDLIINAPTGYEAPMFSWNPQRTSQKLELSDNDVICQSKDGNGFKTVLGNQIFTAGGRYYFEIFLNKGHLLKIGVSRPDVNVQSAFCDTVHGWGMYNGELRHNSNSAGKKYGREFKTGDIVGVALDMIEGSLAFYRNGESWGVAYSNQKLKEGELVAAVAPLHENDVFSLRTSTRED